MKNVLSDNELMKVAIEEQNKCTSYPKVGAVIAKDGKILAKAYKNEKDGKHAERIAIEKLQKSDLKGATIITTLEPCVEVKCDQTHMSCTELIIESQFSSVIIGVLDPNGQIYSQGYEKLLNNKIKVTFFDSKLRNEIETNTFQYGDCNIGYGHSGKRRVAVLKCGKNFEVQYSTTDSRSIKIRWDLLQFEHKCVDLHGVNDNNSIRFASGAKNFNQISDPLVFRETSHCARMEVGDIAVVSPTDGPFILLIKLLAMTETDIFFQWEIRIK